MVDKVGQEALKDMRDGERVQRFTVEVKLEGGGPPLTVLELSGLINQYIGPRAPGKYGVVMVKEIPVDGIKRGEVRG